MNHVPDEALAAVDNLGEGLLVGEARPVRCRLRSDLRLVIPLGDDAIADGATRVEFHIEHTRPHERLAAYGSFVETVVEGVESRLREWGVDPPERYDHDPGAGAEGWLVYAGRVRL